MTTQAEPSRAAPSRGASDLVLEAPHADEFVTIGGLESPIGPGSTLDAVAIIDATEVRTVEFHVARRAMPPVIARASAVGAERSKTLFDEAYREHARRLARLLDQQGGGLRGDEPHDSQR